MKPKILVTRLLPPMVMDCLRDRFEVLINPHDREMTRAELLGLKGPYIVGAADLNDPLQGLVLVQKLREGPPRPRINRKERTRSSEMIRYRSLPTILPRKTTPCGKFIFQYHS